MRRCSCFVFFVVIFATEFIVYGVDESIVPEVEVCKDDISSFHQFFNVAGDEFIRIVPAEDT